MHEEFVTHVADLFEAAGWEVRRDVNGVGGALLNGTGPAMLAEWKTATWSICVSTRWTTKDCT